MRALVGGLAREPLGRIVEMKAVELWGGVECTVSRVGDRWGDQLVATGHHDRASDIDRIAALGLSAVRYPILWERVAPQRHDQRDWSWSDDRLARLQRHGLRVIAGLVHHGSGPHYTDLTQTSFASGLAAHARAVAERYPWIEDWTPVNEPVTTARFSALYGHWYPHTRDERTFWLALLNQIDATRLAMAEVRAVNPAARLIQTDDLGRTYATAPLRGQAAFDNMRRWAGWDLLCGRVTPAHPLFERLARYGLDDRARAIADAPCPPDIIGINHYLTSDRFIDHRTSLYGHELVGGNERDRYVDVAAIRVLDPAAQGLAGALREAWRRYRIPIAVTEAHNGCTRDEQLRWMLQAWCDAETVAAEGADIRAVTSWGLFGSRGWNTLLRETGTYEAGAFDVSSGTPRPTAVARLLRALATGAEVDAVAAAAGWWQQPVRFGHVPVARPAAMALHQASPDAPLEPSPVLICGATGTLGQALARACRHRNLRFVLTDRAALALDDPATIERALDRHRPWVVINAAGWVRVDEAEDNERACFAANAEGAIALARACEARGIQTVSFSSDLVFDGEATDAFNEAEPAAPRNAYGRSKLAAEQGIGRLAGCHLVVRTAAFFSPFDPHNFAWSVAETLHQGRRFAAASDQVVSPTYVPHLADAVLDLAIDREQGLWHLTSGDALSWSDFARRIAEACGLEPSLIDAVPGEAIGLRAPRPGSSALKSHRGTLMPPLGEAIAAFAHERARLATHRKAA